jgi:hypothetical protein
VVEECHARVDGAADRLHAEALNMLLVFVDEEKPLVPKLMLDILRLDHRTE